jgi:hypothetical protein
VANTIVLRAGRYRLSLGPSGTDDNSSGDLDVAGARNLALAGASPARTVIDASGLGDRALLIAGGSTVSLSNLTIRGGHAPSGNPGAAGVAGLTCAPAGAGSAGANGGGIFNAGRLTLRNVAVTGNVAGGGGTGGAGGAGAAQASGAGCSGAAGGPGGDGGGIYNQGTLTVTGSFVSGNRAGAGGAGGAGATGTTGPGLAGAGGPGGSGGGVFSTLRAANLVNSTFVDNVGGDGGPGSVAGTGGSGGAVAVRLGASTLVNDTVAHNEVGAGGLAGASRGAGGLGGGVFVESATAQQNSRLQNTIVASNSRGQCAGDAHSAITNGGHNLSFDDSTCPGIHANPELGKPRDNGGPTKTLALGRGSPAINRVPKKHADCPRTDERGVQRPQRGACDIGAFEFALPQITILQPSNRGSYERGSHVRARFLCSEGGITSPIARCRATARSGHWIDTHSVGTKRFRVIVVDKAGHRLAQTVRYTVWAYVNPMSQVSALGPRRIDMGVDYSGSGPVLALGDAKITFASNNDDGPPSCWGITCWPGGGAVVYQLTDGPFAGKYVYYAEHITVTVRAGQLVKAGQPIAIMHYGYPNIEVGWASGRGPETLAIAYGHQASGDPGGWSAIEGRNFNSLLVRLGAPSGFLQPGVPSQGMPRGWPALPARVNSVRIPASPAPMADGAPPPAT